MERMEVRIPYALSMLSESEKGTFSKTIASSAKLRVAVLEKRLREAQAMLQKFEDKYGKAYPDFERDFPEPWRHTSPRGPRGMGVLGSGGKRLLHRLVDGSSLRVSEFTISGEDPVRYSYYWLDSADALIAGWDNAPHHREVSTFPHHKHLRRQDNVLPSEQRNLRDVLREIQRCIGEGAGPQPTS